MLQKKMNGAAREHIIFRHVAQVLVKSQTKPVQVFLELLPRKVHCMKATIPGCVYW